MRSPGVLAVVATVALVGCVEPYGEPTLKRPAPWEREVVDLFRELPTQEGGRIKPLGTFAGFKLLNLNGKRSCYTPWKEELEPVTWLLDCVYYPEVAEHYRCIVIPNDEVLDAIGLGRREAAGKSERERNAARRTAPGVAARGPGHQELDHRLAGRGAGDRAPRTARGAVRSQWSSD